MEFSNVQLYHLSWRAKWREIQHNMKEQEPHLGSECRIQPGSFVHKCLTLGKLTSLSLSFLNSKVEKTISTLEGCGKNCNWRSQMLTFFFLPFRIREASPLTHSWPGPLVFWGLVYDAGSFLRAPRACFGSGPSTATHVSWDTCLN